MSSSSSLNDRFETPCKAEDSRLICTISNSGAMYDSVSFIMFFVKKGPVAEALEIGYCAGLNEQGSTIKIPPKRTD